MARTTTLALFASISLSVFVAGCTTGGGDEPRDEDFSVGTSREEAKESVAGPMQIAGSPTEVWAVKNQWADRDTQAAKLAGVAWGASSGLSWEEKYAKWISSFPRAEGATWGKTVQIPTPYAKTVTAPVLECAETAMLLRIAFASWYKLPFYLEGWDSKGKQRMFAGHFGFVAASGARISPFPWFKTAYADKEPSWKEGQPWPTDPSLRKLHLGSDDAVPGLETGAGAGAYFDELFLNKRAGYFARLALLYFGSANLADGANMIHVKPETIRPGDVLLERWQRAGIGHTLPIVAVAPVGDKLAVSVVSGSMPRRQPLFEGPSSAKRYFTAEETGGLGNAWDGNPYAKLGGGLRRFRVPVLKGGRWSQEIPKGSESAYIADADLAAISARPAAFESLLSSGDATARRKAALEVIEGARVHLRAHPASCAARDKREDGFAMLYEVEAEAGSSRDAVDAAYREVEDYVFAPLAYNQAKTCCWNTTTDEMGAIILDLAKKEQADAAAAGVCAAPTVFRSRTDGYARWKTHADALGKGAAWRAWSADETCPQAGVAEDALGATSATAYCALQQ